MFEELIGKNVRVNMLFSSYGGDGGASPASYIGTVSSVKDGFIKLQVSSYNITYDGPTKGLGMHGAVFISQKTQVNKVMYFNITSISYIAVND